MRIWIHGLESRDSGGMVKQPVAKEKAIARVMRHLTCLAKECLDIVTLSYTADFVAT